MAAQTTVKPLMNHHEMGAAPASRVAASSAAPTLTKIQRARVLERMCRRCLARVSSASCASSAASADMGTRWPAPQPGGRGAAGWGLHPEQVAEIEEEPVRRATQVAKLERVGLGERRAVPEEHKRPGTRIVRDQADIEIDVRLTRG